MKLLIVDDEKLTREGIRDSLTGDSPLFDSVLLADDGVHGLHLALKEQPDVVLTDVRMPRMTGVEMAEKILVELPDTSIIFMSAYSDKEYLKAAIKLKAVSYVEKPLNMNELLGALVESIRNCQTLFNTRSAVKIQEKEQTAHLVLLLTSPEPHDILEAQETITQLNLPITSGTCFSSIIIDCLTPLSEMPEEDLILLEQDFTNFITAKKLEQIRTFRADHYIYVFLYSDKKLEEWRIADCTGFLQERLKKLCHFFLAVGPIVTGPDHVFTSYENARQLLADSFFQEYDTVLHTPRLASISRPPADVLMNFTMALSKRQKDQALEIIKTLHESMIHSAGLTPSQVRDIYYKYFVRLDENAMNNHISLWSSEGMNPESIWDGIMRCATVYVLRDFLVEKVHEYFQLLERESGENPVVFQIKEFLHQNYAVSSLSVPDVSEYTHRSPSYVCTLFKAETGQTLNQYLTDYRIKMSKQFLSDSRYKITDISSRVGYNDGNYYSKAFKKLVGLSPSEYREKMLL